MVPSETIVIATPLFATCILPSGDQSIQTHTFARYSRAHVLSNDEVRPEGLEPPHLSASGPKPDVSTDSTTGASTDNVQGRAVIGVIVRLPLDHIHSREPCAAA